MSLPLAGRSLSPLGATGLRLSRQESQRDSRQVSRQEYRQVTQQVFLPRSMPVRLQVSRQVSWQVPHRCLCEYRGKCFSKSDRGMSLQVVQ